MQSQFKENYKLQKFKILNFQNIYNNLKMQKEIFKAFFKQTLMLVQKL